MDLDHSVYPDLDEDELPETLSEDWQKADYMDRICAAIDFGIPPEPATMELFSQWKDIFDKFPIPNNPAYHAIRAINGWEEVPRIYFGGYTPPWERQDQREGRKDPCENMV